MTADVSAKDVLLFGATGTIGRATLDALLRRGHRVTCFLRQASSPTLPAAVTRHYGDVMQPDGVFENAQFDAVVSCMASRSGMPDDAWAIDHDAHMAILQAAKRADVAQFVQLSALCVQKPQLPFQHAKRAFEDALRESGLVYSIVRPTAFFKSLSGQVARVKAGKPFLVFGDGALTACKPISDQDLGNYIADCLTDAARANKTLPIGGPGPAITPKEQAEALFDLLGTTPNIRHVPIVMMDAIIAGLSLVGLFSAKMRNKAELARIGRYYATESMLVWDHTKDRYSADDTPEFGSDTIQEFYAQIVRGDVEVDLGDHAVF